MIRLENVSKIYAGHAEPAVDSVSMLIPEGEIVIFLGPSGCGKTTTLKMINRLIEPTSGEIFLGGENVTHSNPNLLRRRIGYVIQQIGLFPHMTIGDNIAVVPKMLGWPKERIRERVDTLLSMVGLNPKLFAKRYPRQLSGGQQQRVGVARALAADPPVLLMDEPFGATDPITREHLQDELLRIQSTIKKTIVFVTHDIDEALRLGDRIAILREKSHIAQYAPPDELLARPANEFVSSFIGSGVSLKRLQVIPISAVRLENWPTVSSAANEGEGVVVLDEGRPTHLLKNGKSEDLRRPEAARVSPYMMLHSALDKLLVSDVGAVCVTDNEGRYQGVITIETIMRELRSTHLTRHEFAPTEGGH